jgi:hypothetical protein
MPESERSAVVNPAKHYAYAWLQIGRWKCFRGEHGDRIEMRNTYSGGVEKSALSIPAEFCTEMVTLSFPAPPLPKLLFWHVFVSPRLRSLKPRWGTDLEVERRLGEAVA